MTFTKVVHEGGLTAYSAPESQLIRQKHGLRPVLSTLASSTGDLDFLLSGTGIGGALNRRVSPLNSKTVKNGRLLPKAFALSYDVGATLHHCASLAKAYGSIVNNFQRTLSIESNPISKSDLVVFGNQEEPYYELDALLSASRRAYDKIGHYVWHAFEGAGGGMPDNMSQTLDRLKTCPQPLANRLRNSWTTVGERLKDYRDCTQHFASVDIGFGAVMMKNLREGVWRAWARIPDNPEVKSKKRFTYRLELDALSYGWNVANEVVLLTREALDATSVSENSQPTASE
jgi:hypothetical protein